MSGPGSRHPVMPSGLRTVEARRAQSQSDPMTRQNRDSNPVPSISEGTRLVELGWSRAVEPSRYVPPPVPKGRWSETLQEAENDAMRRANDYLAMARDRRRALLPEYRASAQRHYDWELAVETFSELSDNEGGSGDEDMDITR